jgi:hypothetical protein
MLNAYQLQDVLICGVGEPTSYPVSHTVANVDMPAATAAGSSTTAALKKAAPKMPTIAPINGK